MQGLRARICALAAQQLRAPLPAGKSKVVDRGPAKTGQLSVEVVTGVAIKKGESDPPILADSEYPTWLFELMKPEPSVAELERMYKQEGLELHQMKRLFRYKNKMRIKEHNAASAKK
ncbi:mitochondrial ribosomal protein L37-domain-containing protein [Scenedesmus sp. NREL 46B-D3]|nr:mitochondrial ribosomal protein L37-domain-containing protein [Scenedesmus sp. NREL 46B-D3]